MIHFLPCETSGMRPVTSRRTQLLYLLDRTPKPGADGEERKAAEENAYLFSAERLQSQERIMARLQLAPCYLITFFHDMYHSISQRRATFK
jgi:hypothetical protein